MRTSWPYGARNSSRRSASRLWQRRAARQARRAWSGWSSGAFQKAMMASPSYLSSVPPEVEDDVRHLREIGVEQADEVLGREPLGDRGEAGDVGEEGRDLPPLAAQPEEGRVVEDAVDDLRAQIMAEGALDEAALAPFDAVAEEGGGDEGAGGGEGRGDELDPDARPRGQERARRRGRGQGQAERGHVPGLLQQGRPDAGGEGQKESGEPR